MKITSDMVVKQLRIYAFGVQGWTKKELAKRTGVAEICLRHIHDDDWNPTLKTLRILEKVIPEDWTFEEVPPSINPQPKETANDERPRGKGKRERKSGPGHRAGL